jgi:beta-glucanase (GH16 family)
MGRHLGDVAKAGTEIDICEHRSIDDKGRDISNMYVMNLHWDGYGKSHKSAGGKSKVPTDAPPLQDNWHTYALLWTTEGYTFYLDGNEQWSSTNAISHHPEFIHLTCEVEKKGWAGAVPEGGFGSRSESKTKMEVDWVRVWQKK